MMTKIDSYVILLKEEKSMIELTRKFLLFTGSHDSTTSVVNSFIS